MARRPTDEDLRMLAEAVRQARGRRSYRAAAREAPVTPMALWKVEHGQSVRGVTVLRVLRWLGIWPGPSARRPSSSRMSRDRRAGAQAARDRELRRLLAVARATLEAAERIGAGPL